MKRTAVILIMLLFISFPVYAEDTYIKGEDEYNNNVERIIKGEFSLNPLDILNKTKKLIIKEVSESKKIIADIIVIAVVSGVLNILDSSFGEGESTNAAFFACFGVISVSVLDLLYESVGYGVDVIERLSGFILKISPMIAVLMVSSGACVSAKSFYPVLSGAVYAVTAIIRTFIIPLVYLSGVLSIVNNVSNKIQLKKLNELIKSFSNWVLLGILTVFSGVNAIYGFSVPVLDAVSLKALKFTVGSLVPVVGGVVSDSVETILGSAKLMKNAVGTAGIITVISVCAAPIIKLGVIILMLKLASVAVEPICDKRISDMISDAVTPVTMVFSMVIATAMLFIINIAVMIGATGI